jgi:hypothetical protein
MARLGIERRTPGDVNEERTAPAACCGQRSREIFSGIRGLLARASANADDQKAFVCERDPGGRCFDRRM